MDDKANLDNGELLQRIFPIDTTPRREFMQMLEIREMQDAVVYQEQEKQIADLEARLHELTGNHCGVLNSYDAEKTNSAYFQAKVKELEEQLAEAQAQNERCYRDTEHQHKVIDMLAKKLAKYHIERAEKEARKKQDD